MATVKPPEAVVLSLPETLRIMDVATALRQERELVEEQLNVDELKARLRAKLVETANVTGEEITPAEVDAAIDQYYARMYTYREPPMNFEVALAHLYVRRTGIARACGVALGCLLVGWWLYFSAGAPMTARGRAHREAARLAAGVARRHDAIAAAATDPEARAELDRLAAEAGAYRARDDVARLRAVDDRLADLDRRLDEEYAVHVLQGNAKGGTALTRYIVEKEGARRLSAYYLIVEARTPAGAVLTRRIHNSETDRDHDVARWAERVPREVYERIGRDKKEDGLLDESTFAVKRRGRLGEQVTMPGADGQPLRRLGQITEW